MKARWLEKLASDHRSLGAQLALGFSGALIAALLRVAIDPWLGHLVPWALFFPAVLVAAVAGGSVAATSALVFSMLAGQLLFNSPRSRLFVPTFAELVSLTTFGLMAALIAALGALLRRTLVSLRRKTDDALDRGERLRLRERQLEIQVEDLTRLHRVSTALAGTFDLDDLLRRILDAVTTVQPANQGFIELYDPDTRSLSVAVSVGHSEQFLSRLEHVPAAEGQGAWGAVAARRSRVIVEDVEADPLCEAYREAARAAGFRGVSSTPLLTSQGELVGVLSTHFADVYRPTERELRLVDLYARLAADAVHAVQLLDRAEKARDEAEQARVRSDLHAENSPLAIVEWNSDYRIIRWSAEAERVFGWTAAEVLGKRANDLSLLYGEDIGGVQEVMRHMDDGTALRNVSFNRNRHKDGRIIHCAWYNSSLLDEHGNKISVYSQVLDRTKEVEALEALQEANKRKDEFLAMLAHELRNPLAPIRNAVEVLRVLGPEDKRMTRARELIDRQVTHMSRLVDDLLDVSRITRGKITLRKELVRLSEVLEHAVEEARPFTDAHEHTLSLRLPSPEVYVEADRARLAQVVGNLLSNAAKFTPAGGHIAIESGRNGAGQAFVRVRDTGIGIPQHLLRGVFDLFAQEDDGLARASGGLGIGLTLVKRLVELHGGGVAVKSEGRGRGSEFMVTLPVAADVEVSKRADAGATLGMPGHGLRVLIVEDNLDAAESFRMLLELFGHDVRAVHCGADALGVLDEFVPDVTFMDVGLPGMDGFELAERFRADPRTRNTVVVAVTGYGRDEDKQRAREAGFDHHMTKPVDLAGLASIVSALGVAVVPLRESSTLH